MNGHEKWVDFICKFYHCDCVRNKSLKSFSDAYEKWCKKTDSQFSSSKAEEIYNHSKTQVATEENNSSTKLLIRTLASSLIVTLESVNALQKEMDRLA